MISNSNTNSLHNPLVTIVALCYNQAHFALETLDSILAQTYTNIQLIITDDASTDNSVEVINSWIAKNNVDCTFIRHQKNEGICKTLNEALELAHGEYLEMVACDDIYLSEKTEALVYFLENNTQYAMVYSDALLIQANSKPQYGLFIQRHRNFIELPQGNIFNTLLEGNFIPSMGTLVRTSIINELYGWDENLLYEDFDFWLRLSKQYKIGCYPTPLSSYRLHSTNMHKTTPFELQKLKILQKHIENNVVKEKYQTLFFDLYKKKYLTKKMRQEYYTTFSNSRLAILVKVGIPYPLYKTITKLFL